MDAIIYNLQKAFKYLNEDPSIGLTSARTAIEAIIKDIVEVKARHLIRMRLDEKIRALTDLMIVPKMISLEMHHIRIAGNYMVHASENNETVGDIAPHVASLKKISIWYFKEYKRTGYPEELNNVTLAAWEPKITTLKEITDWGWKPEEIVKALIGLDYETMNGIDELHVGTHEQWIPIYKSYPDLWVLLTDAPKSIVGYWHYIALSEAEFETAINGKLHDNMIRLENIIFPSLPGEYDIYFSCIALLKKYRDIKGFKLLFESFISKLDELASYNVFIRRICANAFTEEGIALCRTARMDYICEHEDAGKVFLLDMNDPPKLEILKHFPGLLEKYKKWRLETRK